MAAESKRLVPWQEAFAADPFVIVCCRLPDAEQFVIVPADHQKRATVEAMGLPVAGFMAEDELRSRLVRAGLTEREIDIRIQLARDWATTVTRQSRSE